VYSLVSQIAAGIVHISFDMTESLLVSIAGI
jgi:hypothetical protein